MFPYFFEINKPNPPLNQIIHHYEWFDIRDFDPNYIQTLPPTFATGLIFFFYQEEKIYSINEKAGHLELNECTLLGPMNTVIKNKNFRSLKIFRAIFNPGGFNATFDLPMKDFLNLYADPVHAVDKNISDIYDRMRNNPIPKFCIHVFEEYLIKKLRFKNKSTLFDDLLFTLKRNKSIRYKAKNLAQYTGWSEGHLNRKIRDEFGLSTKTFLNIHRFTNIWKKIHYMPNIEILDLAYDFSYTDQAHFSNHFKLLSGYSPKKYLKKIRDLNILEIDEYEYSGVIINRDN